MRPFTSLIEWSGLVPRTDGRYQFSMRFLPSLLPLTLFALVACHANGPNVPGDANDHQPFGAIAPDETLHFTGTEPFWGGTVAGTALTYTTPEDPAGQRIAVSRFAGRGGLSFSGTLASKDLTMVFTPGTCSDGMSDRHYPFVVTLRLGQATRNGCGWSPAHPYAGQTQP